MYTKYYHRTYVDLNDYFQLCLWIVKKVFYYTTYFKPIFSSLIIFFFNNSMFLGFREQLTLKYTICSFTKQFLFNIMMTLTGAYSYRNHCSRYNRSWFGVGCSLLHAVHYVLVICKLIKTCCLREKIYIFTTCIDDTIFAW